MKIDEAIDDLYTILGQHNGEYMDYASYEAAVDNLNIISNFVIGTRWIPVSERWPTKEDGDRYGTVQWCILYKGQHQVIFDEHYQWRSKDGVQTHWMPLPEPPEQEV